MSWADSAHVWLQLLIVLFKMWEVCPEWCGAGGRVSSSKPNGLQFSSGRVRVHVASPVPG